MNTQPMPDSGGCYIRNPDGSLTLDVPAFADDAPAPEADDTLKSDNPVLAPKAARVKEA